jgi:hypothetical protein
MCNSLFGLSVEFIAEVILCRDVIIFIVVIEKEMLL